MKKPRVIARYVPLAERSPMEKLAYEVNVNGALRALRATKISIEVVDGILADLPPELRKRARKRRQHWITFACKTILDETRKEPL